MSQKTIERALGKALLEEGEMSQRLFEEQLQDQIDAFLVSKRKDRDDFFFALTASAKAVAMVLIDKQNKIHVNDKARALLKEYWGASYELNLKLLIPEMAAELDMGFLSVNGVKIQAPARPGKPRTQKQPAKSTAKAAAEKPRCGLCGKTRNLVRTECCGSWICDDYDKYVLFSYSNASCQRNHDRYTLCSHHFNEGHSGEWKTCQTCRDDFETEMYVYYGTNEYNFEKLENPPKFKPTRCARCNRVISLGYDGYSIYMGKYYCMRCSASVR